MAPLRVKPPLVQWDIRSFFGGGGSTKAKPAAIKAPSTTAKKSVSTPAKSSLTKDSSNGKKTTQKPAKTPDSNTKSKRNSRKTSKNEESVVIDSDSDFDSKTNSKSASDSQKSRTIEESKKDKDKQKSKDKNGNIRRSSVQSSPEMEPEKKKQDKKSKKSERIERSSSPDDLDLKKKEKKRKKSDPPELFSSPEMKKSSKKKRASALIESSDDEEVIQVKSKKKKGSGIKKGVIFDSDSDEDPIPKKKRSKPKKKEFSSDEEQISISEAFQHAKAHSKPKTQISPKTKVKTPPKNQISVMDFFGTASVQRVERKTPASKRKAESSPVKGSSPKAPDFEDDDDFEETLRQLDEDEGHKNKKARIDEEPKSLSSKLSQKVKDSYRVEETPEKPSSSSQKIPQKSKVTSPVKITKVISPVKTSPVKKSPVKKSPEFEKNTSPDKPEMKKTNTGYKSYLTRDGPRCLGSKEMPEGADNCLEGLTFVVTGILESFERDEVKSAIERLGGKVTGSLSKKTSYMLAGRDAGESKLSKAATFGTNMLDEDGFLDLLRTLPGKKSKYEIAAEKESKSTPARKISPQNSKTTTPKQPATPSTPVSSSSKSIPNTPKILSTPSTPKASPSVGASQQTPSKGVSGGDDKSLMWVDKYKPSTLKQVIGQQGDKSNAKKLLSWLKAWHRNVAAGKKPAFNKFNDDGSGYRAALLSGPPGIGKTTTAHLVCQEAGFDFVELNASDTRSKKSLKEEVAESLNNHSLTGYFGDSASKGVDGKTHCLVMDEVDGMAGNEDRGGIQELVGLIKNTKIPIICMCNDRNHMKMRTLSNHCFDLRFQRPRVEQIKSAMMSLAFKEGIKIPPPALNEIILASNQDIRQVIHNLSMWSASEKNLSYDQLKSDASKAKKDLKIGPFDVVRKVFATGEETANMSIHDKSDLFFHDYSFGPLFVQETYITVQPVAARGDVKKHLELLSRAADSIAVGDIVSQKIRGQQQWSMLPVQAMFSSVIPGDTMRGYLGGQIQFPSWLGKNSTQGKHERILQELKSHMRLKISGDKKGLNMEYLPHLRTSLTSPLVRDGADGVPTVIQALDNYDLLKEDFDSILEVSQWPNSKNVMASVESKTKAAFTRAYNKEVHMTPYATGTVAKKGRGGGGGAADVEGLEEEGETSQVVESEEEKDDDLTVDSMIKKKKAPAKGKGRGSAGETTSKGKGPAKGRGRGKGKGKS